MSAWRIQTARSKSPSIFSSAYPAISPFFHIGILIAIVYLDRVRIDEFWTYGDEFSGECLTVHNLLFVEHIERGQDRTRAIVEDIHTLRQRPDLRITLNLCSPGSTRAGERIGSWVSTLSTVEIQ